MFRFPLCLLFAGLVCCGAPLWCATYEVGPGHPLAEVQDVPWESLQPGDTVLIYWRAASYRAKFVLCRRGTQQSPIVVRGIANSAGALPVIDGQNAITRTQLNYWNENRGVIKIGGANSPPDLLPAYLVVENLEIINGSVPFSFTGRNGLTSYVNNSAAIFIEKGEHLVIRNCVLRECGNGFFAASQTSDVLVEGCYLRDNGNSGSIYEHNNYTEAAGIVFQFNRFGPLRAGAGGNNLKDRSAGLVVRYNWIEGGNRQLDLVDSDYAELRDRPDYRQTLVYGNVLIEPDGAGNSQIVHYGGDSGDETHYRKGVLQFYQNTVVSTRTGNTTLVRLSSQGETCDARNNILFVTAPGNRLAMLAEAGVLQLRNNWMKPGRVVSHGATTGVITAEVGNITGNDPGFQDFSAQDFRLRPDAAARGAGGALAVGVPGVDRQYLKHFTSAARPVAGPADLGAFGLLQSAARCWSTYH